MLRRIGFILGIGAAEAILAIGTIECDAVFIPARLLGLDASNAGLLAFTAPRSRHSFTRTSVPTSARCVTSWCHPIPMETSASPVALVQT